MNEKQWAVDVSMNPLQLSNPRVAFKNYTKTFMNKYVPDLQGFLVKVDMSSLKVRPSPDLATNQDRNRSCFVRLNPTCAVTKAHFIVNTTIFQPSVGQEFDATIKFIKKYGVFCKIGKDFSVDAVVSLRSNDAEPIPLDPETGLPIRLFPFDTVRVVITKVGSSFNNGNLRLFARILSVKVRGKIGMKALKLDAPKVDEPIQPELATTHIRLDAEEDGPPKKKKKKHHHKNAEEVEAVVEPTPMEGVEEYSVENKEKRKSKKHKPGKGDVVVEEQEMVEPPKKSKSSKKRVLEDLYQSATPEIKQDPDAAPKHNYKKSKIRDESVPVVQKVEPFERGQSPDIFDSSDEEEVVVKGEAH